MSDVTTLEPQTKTSSTEKIYCANCIHCKLVTTAGETSDEFYLRVRCDAGKWKKKLGEEKIHKYFTVARRSIDYCDMYEDMGDPEDFMKELKMNLPSKDESYDKYDKWA
ncbi:MAG: hypothetical protein K5839_08265 [Treponemataceae bacterium]|nr:hypothetical protein [Treponemataceae bacterium]